MSDDFERELGLYASEQQERIDFRNQMANRMAGEVRRVADFASEWGHELPPGMRRFVEECNTGEDFTQIFGAQRSDPEIFEDARPYTLLALAKRSSSMFDMFDNPSAVEWRNNSIGIFMVSNRTDREKLDFVQMVNAYFATDFTPVVVPAEQDDLAIQDFIRVQQNVFLQNQLQEEKKSNYYRAIIDKSSTLLRELIGEHDDEHNLSMQLSASLVLQSDVLLLDHSDILQEKTAHNTDVIAQLLRDRLTGPEYYEQHQSTMEALCKSIGRPDITPEALYFDLIVPLTIFAIMES